MSSDQDVFEALVTGAPIIGKMITPVQFTKAIVLTACFGVLIGLILSKVYLSFLNLLFGSGHLRGRPDLKFQSFWVETSHGRVRTVRVTGRRLTSEKRPLVMLIHGYAGSLDVYADPCRSNYCARLCDAGFDVVAFDLYGHGGSDCPDTLFSAELFASQVAEVCISLDIREPFILLAHSMGSSVAVTFTHRYPSLVSKLILISPSVADKPMELRLRIALRIPFFREVLSYFIIPTFGEGTNDDNAGMLRACYRLLETRLRSGGSWNAGDVKTLQMLEKLARSPSLSSSHSILVLWGESDDVIEFDQAKLLAPVIPHARLCVLGEADHMAFADGSALAREFFAERILAFLKEEPGRFTTSLGDYFSDRGKDDGMADVRSIQIHDDVEACYEPL